MEYVDVRPKTRPFDGDPFPRVTYGHDFEPVPPFGVSPGWALVREVLEVLEDAEDEMIRETEDRRVLEVPCVVDTRDRCLDVLGRGSELVGEVAT